MTAKALPPDQDQRDLIRNELDKNMLVEAAAGTGKTESMVGRMVELLRTGNCADIRNLVAVTFTRKAAAELRARFQIALEQATGQATGADRERLDAALAAIEQCFIGTIHSFCARLLRERPVEAGVDVAFREIDDDEDMVIRQEAWFDYCSRVIASDPEGVLAGLDRVGLELADLREAFKKYALYPDVDTWPEPPDGGALPDLEPVIAALGQYVEHMEGLAPDLPRDTGSDGLIPRIRKIPRAVSHFDDLRDPRQLMQVLEFFDSKSGETQKVWESEGKFTKADGKVEGQRWNDFRENYVKPMLNAWRESRYGPALRVLSGARDLYDRRRMERGVLNFQDLLMRSASLLRENPHVRRYFSARFTHLLVDEFQDTDPIQAEVMLLITSTDPSQTDWRKCSPKPGSLFVVGDPKQSIYRFRRADIVTYNEVKHIILHPAAGMPPGVLVRLSTNFRTVEPLIEWINGVFESNGADDADEGSMVMLRFTGDDREQSPAYVSLQPGRQEGSREGFRGIHALVVGEAAGGKEEATLYEADNIARFIRAAIDDGMKIPRTVKELERGRTPEVDPSDFMIITWYTASLSVYAAKLQEYGIPQRVTGGTGLNEVDELKLLSTCINTLFRSDDPVALVGALRSEAFGISDAALYRFKRAGGRFDFSRPVPVSLPEGDHRAFEDSFEQLRKYHQWFSAMPAVSALEKMIADLGLMVMASARPGGDVQAGSLGKAIELVRSVQHGDWANRHISDYLQQVIDKEQKHDGVSARSEELPAVRVMNLHKVKGLEAPVVFLANAYGEGRHEVELFIDRSAGTVSGYMAVRGKKPEFGPGPLLAHPAQWDELAEKEGSFVKAEDLRLRYVAATRAGSAMVVTQRPLLKLNSRNAWRHFNPLLSDDSALDDPGPQKCPARESSTIDPAEATTSLARVDERLASAVTSTYDARPAKQYALGEAHAEEADRLADQADSTSPGLEQTTGVRPAGESGMEWGQAIHELLELAMRQPEVDIVGWARTILVENELDPGHAEAAAEDVSSVMSSEIWRRSLASPRTLTEVPFEILLDDIEPPTLVRGAIDLIFAGEDGWVLVDYKTDRITSSITVEDLALAYAPQVRLYSKAWERATGERVNEAGLYFVRVGVFVPVQPDV